MPLQEAVGFTAWSMHIYIYIYIYIYIDCYIGSWYLDTCGSRCWTSGASCSSCSCLQKLQFQQSECFLKSSESQGGACTGEECKLTRQRLERLKGSGI